MLNTNTLKSYTPSEIQKLRTLPKLKPYLIKKNGDAVYYLNNEIMFSKFQEDKFLHPNFLDRELFESPTEYEDYCIKKFSHLNSNELEKLKAEKEEKDKEIAMLREQLMQNTIQIENEGPTHLIDENFIAAQTAARASKKSADRETKRGTVIETSEG